MQQSTSRLRAEMEAPHAREATRSIGLLSARGTPQSRNIEIGMTGEEEGTRLRRNHSQEHVIGPSTTSSPPLNEDIVRELASLRADVNQLQQGVPPYEVLPGYTPQPTEQ